MFNVMNGYCRVLVLLVLVWMSSLSGAERRPEKKPPLPQADPAVQRQVASAVSQLLAAEFAAPLEYEKEMERCSQTLVSSRQKGRNVLQGIALHLHHIAGAEEPDDQKEARYQAALFLMNAAYSDGEKPVKDDVIRDVTPLLTYEDPVIEEVVSEALNMAAYEPEGYDFAVFKPLLKRERPPEVVVDYMLRMSPFQAFHVLWQVAEPDEKTSAELKPLIEAVEADDPLTCHRLGKPRPSRETAMGAVEALKSMAERDEWWVKRFADEMVEGKYRRLIRAIDSGKAVMNPNEIPLEPGHKGPVKLTR